MTSHLCHLFTDWGGKLPPGGAMAEIKVDGWRCLWFRGIDGIPRLWSRNGMPLEGAAHVAWRCKLLEQAAGHPLFLDGEIQVGGTLAATKHWFETGWKLGGEAGVLHLFDAMPEAEWRAGGSATPLYERKATLSRLVASIADPWEWRPGSHGRDDPACVRVVPDEWVFTPDCVLDLANRVWAGGGEGLVIKDPATPYRRLRTGDWLKVKQENRAKWATAWRMAA